eukprot:jgi/Mesen1/4724/ME000241S03763
MSSATDMFQVQHTQGTVLCCLCGTSILPNPSNMCVACIRTQVDITEGLQKQITILYCRECGRYLQPPKSWMKAQLESKELLTYCLKRVKNLSKVKLVDAGFVWTEPHSKRLKLKLTIQKEVFNGAILQQTFVIEYVVEDHMCDQCTRTAANPDQWIACVQLRQKIDHKRTFLFLEQLILKHGADAHTINIKQHHDGVDFFYANRSHALRFIEFLNAVVPIQHRNDKQLVSHDVKSSVYNYKYTFSVEISPVCKDDLVCLPHKLAAALGNIGPLVLCYRVSSSLQLLDPATLRLVYLDATQYWRLPFRPLMSAKLLVEYVVLDVEPLGAPEAAGRGGQRLALADVQLTIQKEVFNGAILQQTFVIEYVVEDHMCDQCTRTAANPDQWIACVQLRQKIDHKRTFLFLEQLILKHGADAHTINIKQHHDGVDFFYANRSHALRFIEFLNAVVPIQHRNDKQLVSHDVKSSVYNYKYTFSVEISPVCKDDLVCLPHKLAAALGNIGPLVLCYRVSSSLQLLDPATLRLVYLDATQYWRLPFRPLMSAKLLVEYVVLDVEPLGAPEAAGRGGQRLALADVQVARVADFGKNDVTFHARTHLGQLLSPGDHALGYDLYAANLNDEEFDRLRAVAGGRHRELPDVVLVKKSYEEKRRARRGRPRPWKLKSLAMETDDSAAAPTRVEEERSRADYERFLEEVEEDPELRSKIAVYRDPTFVPRPTPAAAPGGGDEDDDGDEPPEIPLEELLLDLQIGDNGDGAEEDEGDEEGAHDMET